MTREIRRNEQPVKEQKKVEVSNPASLDMPILIPAVPGAAPLPTGGVRENPRGQEKKEEPKPQAA